MRYSFVWGVSVLFIAAIASLRISPFAVASDSDDAHKADGQIQSVHTAADIAIPPPPSAADSDWSDKADVSNSADTAPSEEASQQPFGASSQTGHPAVCAIQNPALPAVTPQIAQSNCGPILLGRVLEKHGQQATLEKLIVQSNTRYGLTSLHDMKRTVTEYDGLYAQAIKTDLAILAELIQKYDVICHFSKNSHYIWMQSVDGQQVSFVDPTWIAFDGSPRRMWRGTFEEIWEGVCLVISDRPLTQLVAKAEILSSQQLKKIVGGTGCNNCNGDGGSTEKDNDEDETDDPVSLSNGNLFYSFTDFSFPTHAGSSVGITRRYDAQVFSDLENWQPDSGTGTWVTQNGVLNGQGDRCLSNNTFDDAIIELDVRTVDPGIDAANTAQTAWIN